MRKSPAVACVAIALGALAVAQTPTGILQGLVTDASGASVPDARVVITNAATNEVRELRTDASGRYFQPFLPPGTYVLSVEKAGFRTVRQDNVKIDVGQNRSVNVTLEVGVVTEEVQVTAAAAPLDTNVATMGQVVDFKRIVNLPLNGRGVFSLANLSPGVNPTGGGSTPHIAGARNATSELQIDGMTNIAPENNVGINDRIYEPQVDAVEEFSVQINALNAEYGRFGGGVINVVTRSGTNQLHGSAYDFLRNSKLDANNFFANRAGAAKASFKRNQWGGVLGGPIWIPGLYDGRDKSFFFFGFEGTNSRSQSVFTGSVPLAEWRAGDYSNLRNASGAPIVIYDPLTVRQDPANPARFTRTPFDGNRIPSSRFDPVAVNAFRFFPAPNTAPTNAFTQANNFTSAGSAASDSYRTDMKFDHNFRQNWRMFARIAVGWGSNTPVNQFGNPGTPSGDGPGTSGNQGASIDHTLTLSPTLVANLRYGFGRRISRRLPFSNGFDLTSLGFAPYVAAAAARDGLEFPRLDFTGYTSLGQATFTRLIIVPIVHDATGSITKILSGHTIKAGMEYRKLMINFSQYGQPSGQYSFNAAWTQQEINTPSSTAGFPFASFLLGLPASGSISHDPSPASASSYFAWYLQDDWKLTRKLTLNLGVRYDFDRPRTERYNRYNRFELYAPSPVAGRVPASACPACGNLLGAMGFVDEKNRRQTPTDLNNVAPRFGFSYQLTRKAVVRGGYGIIYAPSALQAAGHTGTAGMEAYRTSTSFIGTLDSMRTIKTYLRDPYPDGFNFPPGRRDGAATQLGLGVGESVFEAYRNPYIQEWSFNLQRELPGNFLVEAGYIGNRGIALIDGDGGRTFNQLRPSELARGAELLRVVENPFFGVITNPTSPLSQRTVEFRQLLRPYPQYTAVTSFRKPVADSIYHALTLRADKRFSRGFSLLLSYTAGKGIDDSSSAVGFLGQIAGTKLDAYNRRLERALAAFDVAQRLVIGYTYQLPFGKGRRYGSSLPRGVSHLVSGWETNGVATFQSGIPIIVAASQNNTNIFTASQRPNNNGTTANLRGGTTDERLARWFNTSVFSQPGPFTLGNAPRVLPDTRMPGTRNFDLSVFKNIFLGPEGKWTVQYRLEMFNAFNTPQFAGPGTTVGAGNFGVISGTAVAPRQIQMALKLNW